MIFCITLFQRAASRVKKRQSGAEDPRLRAACVNRTPTPSAVMYGRFAHVTGLRMYVRWEWLPVQQTKWYRGERPVQMYRLAFVFEEDRMHPCVLSFQ